MEEKKFFFHFISFFPLVFFYFTTCKTKKKSRFFFLDAKTLGTTTTFFFRPYILLQVFFHPISLLCSCVWMCRPVNFPFFLLLCCCLKWLVLYIRFIYSTYSDVSNIYSHILFRLWYFFFVIEIIFSIHDRRVKFSLWKHTVSSFFSISFVREREVMVCFVLLQRYLRYFFFFSLW